MPGPEHGQTKQGILNALPTRPLNKIAIDRGVTVGTREETIANLRAWDRALRTRPQQGRRPVRKPVSEKPVKQPAKKPVSVQLVKQPAKKPVGEKPGKQPAKKPVEQPAMEPVKEHIAGRPADQEVLAGAVRNYDFPVGRNNVLATLKCNLAAIQETIKGVLNRGPQKFYQSITVNQDYIPTRNAATILQSARRL